MIFNTNILARFYNFELRTLVYLLAHEHIYVYITIFTIFTALHMLEAKYSTPVYYILVHNLHYIY